MVAAEDCAAMVSAALTTPGAGSRRLYVFGPEAVRIADALRVYCRVMHGGKPVVTVPLRVMDLANRLIMGGAGSRELALMRTMQRVGEPAEVPSVGDLLGPATTTLRGDTKPETSEHTASSTAPRISSTRLRASTSGD
jgi:hypothetical protein